MKKCLKCKLNKQLIDFVKSNQYIDGRANICKVCTGIYNRKRYAECNREGIVRVHNTHEYSGKIINGQKTCSQCNKWKEINCFSKASVNSCGLQTSCKECNLWYGRILRKIHKIEFVLAYGGKCQCLGCDENRVEFLTIQHIKGFGKLIYGTPEYIIRALRELGWPKKGYTVLCYNCNCSTKHNRPCVHSDKYKNYEIELEDNIRSNEIRDRYFKLKGMLR